MAIAVSIFTITPSDNFNLQRIIFHFHKNLSPLLVAFTPSLSARDRAY